jgi:filamentous hemagglutinin family protein
MKNKIKPNVSKNKFNIRLKPLYLAMASILPTAAYAGAIIPDSREHNAPTMSQSANNTPVVNIIDPNANGISHNKFDEFNVNQEGVIFNNSMTDGASKIGGFVIKNAQLNNEARAVISEVTGTKGTQLNGAMEVFGRKADVIIANQNGISVNGAVTVNANNLTLTTGKVNPQADGRIQLSVEKGTVNVAGQGISTEGLDYFDIISRSAILEGEIYDPAYQTDLKVLTGLNDYDLQSRSHTVRESVANDKPAVAIDGSALGSMYGGRIQLISTESGAGVRHEGSIVGNQEIEITADGDLRLSGLQSKQSDITLKGNNISVQKSADGYGGVYSNRDILINALGNVDLGANAISQKGRIVINASSLLQNAATIMAENEQMDSVTIPAIQINISDEYQIKGTLYATDANGNKIPDAVITLENGDYVIRSNGVQVQGRVSSNAQLASISGAIDVNAKSMKTNGSGIVAQRGALVLNISELVDNDGMISGSGKLTINTRAFKNKGVIFTDAQLINTKQFDNAGGLYSDGAIDVATESMNNSGVINAASDINLLIDGKIAKNSGKMFAKNIAIDQKNKDQSIQSAAEFTNSGVISANETLKLKSDILINLDNDIYAGTGMDLQLSEKLVNKGKEALIFSDGNLDISGEVGEKVFDIDNSSGWIQGRNISIKNVDEIHNTSNATLITPGLLDLQNFNLLENNESDVKGKQVVINKLAELRNINDSQLYATETLEISNVDKLTNESSTLGAFAVSSTDESSTIENSANVKLDHVLDINNIHGLLASDGNLDITNIGTLNNDDSSTIQARLTLLLDTVTTLKNTALSSIIALDSIDVKNIGNLIVDDSKIVTNNNLNITNVNNLINRGLIQSNDLLTLKNIDNLQNIGMTENGKLSDYSDDTNKIYVGALTSLKTLTIEDVANFSNIEGALIQSTWHILLKSIDALLLQNSRIDTAQQVHIGANDIVMIAGEIVAGSNIVIDAINSLKLSAAADPRLGRRAMELTALAESTGNAEDIEAAETAAAEAAESNVYSQIQTVGGNLFITTNELVNNHSVLRAKDAAFVDQETGEDFNLGGSMQVTANKLDNDYGLIESTVGTYLNVKDDFSNDGGTARGDQSLYLNIDKDYNFNSTSGSVEAGEMLSIKSSGNILIDQSLESQGSIWLDAAKDIVNQSAILSTKDIFLSGKNVTNSSLLNRVDADGKPIQDIYGLIWSMGDLVIRAQEKFLNKEHANTLSMGQMDIVAEELVNEAGIIRSEGNMYLDAKSLKNLSKYADAQWTGGTLQPGYGYITDHTKVMTDLLWEISMKLPVLSSQMDMLRQAEISSAGNIWINQRNAFADKDAPEDAKDTTQYDVLNEGGLLQSSGDMLIKGNLTNRPKYTQLSLYDYLTTKLANPIYIKYSWDAVGSGYSDASFDTLYVFLNWMFGGGSPSRTGGGDELSRSSFLEALRITANGSKENNITGSPQLNETLTKIFGESWLTKRLLALTSDWRNLGKKADYQGGVIDIKIADWLTLSGDEKNAVNDYIRTYNGNVTINKYETTQFVVNGKDTSTGAVVIKYLSNILAESGVTINYQGTSFTISGDWSKLSSNQQAKLSEYVRFYGYIFTQTSKPNSQYEYGNDNNVTWNFKSDADRQAKGRALDNLILKNTKYYDIGTDAALREKGFYFLPSEKGSIVAGGQIVHTGGELNNGIGDFETDMREGASVNVEKIGEHKVKSIGGSSEVLINLKGVEEFRAGISPMSVIEELKNMPAMFPVSSEWAMAQSGTLPPDEQPTNKIIPKYETRFDMVDQSKYFGSEYFFEQVGYKPEKPVNVIGDNYYISELIRRQLNASVGSFFAVRDGVDGVDLVKMLMDNAKSIVDNGVGSVPVEVPEAIDPQLMEITNRETTVISSNTGQVIGTIGNEPVKKPLMTQGEDLGLEIGKPLTEDQRAKLDKDIVWFVYQDVGDGAKALVPFVYLANTTIEEMSTGVKESTGSAVIHADKNVYVDAKVVNNGNGVISAGGSASIKAEGDINNKSRGANGGIIAKQDLILNSTGGSINNDGAYLKAGNDLGLYAEKGSINLTASVGRDEMGKQRVHTYDDAITASGNIDMRAKDITSNAANIAADGSVQMKATDGNITFNEMHEVTADFDRSIKYENALNYSTRKTETTTATAVTGSVKAGKNLILDASEDIIMKGGEYTGKAGSIKAGGTVDMQTSQDYSYSKEEIYTRKFTIGGEASFAGFTAKGNHSGLDGYTSETDMGNYDFDYGSDHGANGSRNPGKSAVAPTFVASYGFETSTDTSTTDKTKNKNASFNFKDSLYLGGETVDIGGADLTVGGRLDFDAGELKTTKYEDVNKETSTHTSTFVGLKNKVASVFADVADKNIGTILNEVSDPEASFDPLTTAAQVAGDVTNLFFNDQISYNKTWGVEHDRSSESSESRKENITHINAGSVDIKTTGDATLAGVEMKAGSIGFDVGGNLLMRAAEETNTSSGNSVFANVGITVGAAKDWNSVGMGISLDASGGNGKTSSYEKKYTNTTLTSDSINFKSGGNTTLAGANVDSKSVGLDIGGDLNITTMQDIFRSDASSWHVGASIGVAMVSDLEFVPTPTGSVNAGGGSDFRDSALTNKQSGITSGIVLDVKTGGDLNITGGYLISEGGTGSLDVAGNINLTELEDHIEQDGQYGGGGGGYTKTGAAINFYAQTEDEEHFRETQKATIGGMQVDKSKTRGAEINTDVDKMSEVTKNEREHGSDISATVGVPMSGKSQKKSYDVDQPSGTKKGGDKPADDGSITPRDTDGITPRDTDGITPRDTDGITPRDTDGTTPRDTDGTTPRDTDGPKLPDEADGTTPKAPEIEPPKAPEIEPPKAPDVEPPKASDIEPPKAPEITPPKAPDATTPKNTDGPTRKDTPDAPTTPDSSDGPQKWVVKEVERVILTPGSSTGKTEWIETPRNGIGKDGTQYEGVPRSGAATARDLELLKRDTSTQNVDPSKYNGKKWDVVVPKDPVVLSPGSNTNNVPANATPRDGSTNNGTDFEGQPKPSYKLPDGASNWAPLMPERTMPSQHTYQDADWSESMTNINQRPGYNV